MIKMKSVYLYGVTLIALFSASFCLPPHQRRLSDQEYNEIIEQENKNNDNSSPPQDQIGIEYMRYLHQVIGTLEKDEAFKQKMESVQDTDIKTGKIAEELEYVNHHVRSKLDELKRIELQRLRELAKQAYGSEHDIHLSPPEHIDHENANTFEIKDLKKLINKVAEDLEEADKKRKQMFKNYEMQKNFERDQKLQNMTEEEKRKFFNEEEEAKRREQEAKKKVHHPGSKQQLEEVWEEQDHMNKNDFNPKTFFIMHDVDGNGFLDEDEVKTLFLKELDKLYTQGMPQADLMERAEEMERMREHVFNEVDKNRDRLISWEEFYAMSLRPEFTEDSGWQPLDEQQIYTPEEMHAFEQQRLAEIERLRKEGKLSYDPKNYQNQEQAFHQAGVQPPHHGLDQLPPISVNAQQAGPILHQQQQPVIQHSRGIPQHQPQLMLEINQVPQNAQPRYNVPVNQVPVAANHHPSSENTVYNADNQASHAKISE